MKATLRVPAPQFRALGILVIAATWIAAAPVPAPAAIAYFSGVGDLAGGPTLSQTSGISGDGLVVVGWSYASSGSQGFRWTAAQGIQGLGTSSNALDASHDGSVIVGAIRDAAPGSHDRAFRWTASAGVVPLPMLPGGTSSNAVGVSASGAAIAGSSDGGGGYQAVYWGDGAMTGLGFLPGHHSSSASALSADGSTVVGTSYSAVELNEAFRWKDGEMIGLGRISPSHTHSYAIATSADGTTVVGRCGDEGGVGDAFIWTEASGMVGLGSVPGATRPYRSQANGISDDGSIIVGDGTTGAFLWDSQHGMRDLKMVLQDEFGLDLAGWTLSSADAVSADGRTIAGDGINPAGLQEGWIAHIPEPATFSMVGVFAIAVLRVRRPKTGRRMVIHD